MLLYSAAVGGSAPILEALRRMSGGDEIRCIAGILSGTCNYVLDRRAEGLTLSERCASRGFAEAAFSCAMRSGKSCTDLPLNPWTSRACCAYAAAAAE
jgi:homoserine dehydrogenase